MPFKSQAQQRAAFGGHLGPEMKKKASTWAHETPNIKSLPKHVKRESAPMPNPQPQQQMNQPIPMEIEVPETGVVDQYAHPGCEDTIGDIYIVLKPNPESKASDLVHKTHAFGVQQFDPHSVHGVYGDEGEAGIVAEGALKDLHKHIKKVEGKKEDALAKIGKHITRLQKEINDHMKSANERPEESDTHHMLAEKKMNIIRDLRDKHKMIKASKKELPKKEEE